MSRVYPCVYCTEDGYCEKYSDEEVTSWCVQSPCKDEKPSNADRIRAFTDEELAKWLSSFCTCGEYEDTCPAIHCKGCGGGDCDVLWLDWLRQEVTDG